jgi:hypothetical protein
LHGVAGGIGGPEIGVNFNEWSSIDGEGVVPGYKALRSATSKPPNEIYTASTACEEREESESGTGPVSYPCLVKVKLTFNTVKNTVSGGYSVKEEATQP